MENPVVKGDLHSHSGRESQSFAAWRVAAALLGK
jgi:hypothetical protein